MKHFLCTLVMMVLALTATAQKEQDFASRYMALYATGTSLQCTTVSPLMLERMMQLPTVEGDDATRELLQQLKSIRMVTNSASAETTALYDKALKLAKRNTARYKVYTEQGNKHLYVRRRGSYIVEMVLFMKHNGAFQLINLTGNMTDDFLKQLFKL